MKGKLQATRKQVEAELKALAPTVGGSRSAHQQIFHYCRLFENEFRKQLQNTSNTVSIKEAFVGPAGLAQALHAVKLKQIYSPEQVRKVCRRSNGYQPHLLSPEKGIKQLVKECMQLMEPASAKCVRDVTLALTQLVMAAASKAISGTPLEPGVNAGPLEVTISDMGSEALGLWSEETTEIVLDIVQMEGSYISYHFFRKLMEERFEDLPEPTPIAEKPRPQRVSSTVSEDSTQYESPEKGSITDLMGGGANKNDYMMGFLEKNSESKKTAMTSVEAWKWQRRWFVLADTKKNLYYFKDPDELPNYRGSINMLQVAVEDLAAKTSRSRQIIQTQGGSDQAFSLLIALVSKDPQVPIYKDHTRMILRAENASKKFEWLARLRQATEPTKAPVARRSTASGNPSPRVAATGRLDSAPNLMGFSSDESDGEPAAPLQPLRSVSGYFKGMLHGAKAGRRGPAADQAFYAQLSEDLISYTRNTIDSLARMIPKAVVHCTVKRAETQLLDSLYERVTNLDPTALASFTSPGDSEALQKRAAMEYSLQDIDKALAVVGELQGGARGKTVALPTFVLELAGMMELADRAGAGAAAAMPQSAYMPRALSGGRRSAETSPAGSRAPSFDQHRAVERPKQAAAPPASPPPVRPRRRAPPPPPPKR